MTPRASRKMAGLVVETREYFRPLVVCAKVVFEMK